MTLKREKKTRFDSIKRKANEINIEKILYKLD